MQNTQEPHQDENDTQGNSFSLFGFGVGVSGSGSIANKLFTGFKLILKWLIKLSGRLLVVGTILLWGAGFFREHFNFPSLAAKNTRDIIISKNEEIKSLIADWNGYDGTKPVLIDGSYERPPLAVKRLKDSLPGLMVLLRETVDSKYKPKFLYFLYYNRARVFMMHGDIENDKKSMMAALEATDFAKSLYADYYSGAKSDEDFIDYIDEQYDGFKKDILRDEMSILALLAYLFDDEEYRSRALKILHSDFKGCDYFYDFTVRHEKIKKALGCITSNPSKSLKLD